MAAFQRLFRVATAPTMALGVTLYATTATTVVADEGAARPIQPCPGHSLRGDKLPIYSSLDREVPITLIENPNPLVDHITRARSATTAVLGEVRSYVEGGVANWIGFERSVEREVKSVVAADEPLTPGIIYVLVSGLTGTVLTRTRSFPIRFLAPPLFTFAALPYFLPKTSHNLRSYLSDLEDKHFPEFAASHDRFSSALELHWQLAIDKIRGAGAEARQWSHKAVDGLERTTGLKVKDAVRISQEKFEEDKQKVVAAVKPPTNVQTVAIVVEQKPVARLVVPVNPEIKSSATSEAAVVPIVQPEPTLDIVLPPVAEVKPEEGKGRLV